MGLKAKPYVYRCEHKETKRFYIGYRSANKLPAAEDLGVHYFTSSDIVSKDFQNYNFEVLSEYDSVLMAYEVEQRLIYECRHDELLINKNFKVRNLIEVDPKPVKIQPVEKNAWKERRKTLRAIPPNPTIKKHRLDKKFR
jgi:hypothetical protein